MASKQQSILIGGLVAGVLLTSYLAVINVLCCLGVVLGGVTAVWHFTATHREPVETGDGAVMGSLAGIAGLLVSTAMDYVLRPLDMDIQSAMMGAMEALYTPEMMEQVRQQMDAAQAQQGIGAIVFNLLIGAVVTAVFGAIGGAIGAGFFGDTSSDAQA